MNPKALSVLALGLSAIGMVFATVSGILWLIHD